MNSQLGLVKVRWEWVGRLPWAIVMTLAVWAATTTMAPTPAHAQAQGPDEVWVDGGSGDDGRDGLSRATAVRTIQRGAELAGAGTTVRILTGVYRESVELSADGSPTAPVTYVAEDGAGTVIIRGSEPSSALSWTQLTSDTIGLPAGVQPTDIYYADLSAWALEGAPRFVLEFDLAGQVAARLPLAREPDWHVETEWKHHEFWWAADGGESEESCDPTQPQQHDCDLTNRSRTQLTDAHDDSEPAGIEAGNLTTLGSLVGARLVAMDTIQGHYAYKRNITIHDAGSSLLTVDEPCGTEEKHGLGWGTKYFVEGLPGLLDEPGEWWYDAVSGRLYLYPRTAGDPGTMNLEISRHDNGLVLNRRSYNVVDGLHIEVFNNAALYQSTYEQAKAIDNTVRNVTVRHVNRGLYIAQGADGPAENVTDGFLLEDCDFGHIDSMAFMIHYWWDGWQDIDTFIRPGVTNTTMRRNEFHHLGFRHDGDTANGANVILGDNFRFENNHVHHVAHNGIAISRSAILSDKEWNFEPDEIRTGRMLFKDNLFEKACQAAADCGGLKLWGVYPDGHVLREVLVTGNVFRDSVGWTYVSEKRGRRWAGTGSARQGMGAFGFYIDHVSGVHAYRNVAYNNSNSAYHLWGEWRDGPVVYWNNVAANSVYGFLLSGRGGDRQPAVQAEFVNNIMVNSEGRGFYMIDFDGEHANVTIDHNLYHQVGWRTHDDGGLNPASAMSIVWEGGDNLHFTDVAEIQAGSSWEAGGREGDPLFLDYDAADHDMFDGSSADFHLQAQSALAIDQGLEPLPDSLVALLELFEVDDPQSGAGWDIGAHEWGVAEGGGGGAGGGGGGGAGGGAGNTPIGGDEESDGCGCRTVGESPLGRAAHGAWLALALAVACGRRRRRRARDRR